MDDLRDEIKAAFDAEWSGHGEAPGLDASISRAPVQHPRRTGIVPAVTAVAVVVVLCAAGFVTLRGVTSRSQSHRPPPPPALGTTSPTAVIPPPSPSPSPSSSPEPDYGTPAAGPALFYYIDPRQPSWLVAVDWAGATRGTIKLPGAPVNPSIYPISSPDGSRVLLNGSVYDLAGQSLGLVQSEKGSLLWADDNRHLCGMSPGVSDTAAGVPSHLYTVLPGQARRTVATVGTAYNQAGADVYACSVRSGVALVVQAYNGNVSESWLVSLVDGHVIRHQLYPRPEQEMVSLVVSPDGRYVAENHLVTSALPGSHPQPAAGVIRDSRTGRAVAAVPASERVIAFSADGTQTLTGTSDDSSVSIRDTLTRAIRWGPHAVAPGRYVSQVMVQPYAHSMVIPFFHAQTTCGSGADPCGAQNMAEIVLVVVGSGDSTIADGVSPIPNG